jgi:hypothetical protein
LERSAAVFSGRVIEIRRHEKASDLFGQVEVVLKVDRSWKGGAERIVSVFTSSQSSACGYGFKKGRAYLIYAQKDRQDRLSTSICSRTKRLKDSRRDLAELGQGKLLP